MIRNFQKIIALGTIACLPASLLVFAVAPKPALANDFENCSTELINRGISQEEAGRSCAQALEPTELSRCVARVQREIAVRQEDALFACYRVRRPNDLASCVVDINRDVLNSVKPEERGNTTLANLTLDNCRRSLLPSRYSECVVGFAKTGEEKPTPEKAMEVCISAESTNRDFSVSPSR